MKNLKPEQKRFVLIPAGIFGVAIGLGHRRVMGQVAAWGITDPIANFAVTMLAFWVPALVVALILRPFYPESPDPPNHSP